MLCLNFLFFRGTNTLDFKKKNKFLITKINIINHYPVVTKKKNILNKKYLNVLFKLKGDYYFIFSEINNLNKKLLLNVIQLFVENNLNFLFYSSDNKMLLPYYCNLLSKDDMFTYKKYIFYNTSYINFNNWLFFLKNFLKKFNVKVIFFLNLSEIFKFLKIYEKINCIKVGIIDQTVLNVNFDYSFFVNTGEHYFYSIFLINYFINTFFKNLNINFYNNKIIYYKNLKKIIEKSYLLY